METKIIGLFVGLLIFAALATAGDGCNPGDPECGALPVDGCNVLAMDFVMTADLDAPVGIDICADDRTIDCGGHRLMGTGVAGSEGITNIGFSNTLIQSCEISDYDYGILFDDADNNVVDASYLHDNLDGIYLDDGSDFNQFTDNSVSLNVLDGMLLFIACKSELSMYIP